MTETEAGRFAGKTIIITGAGSGIGRATAIRIASEGGRIIATDVVAERLEALRHDLDGSAVETVLGDVSTPETIDELLRTAGERIDALANVAGIMDAFLPPTEVDDATWERVFRVNVTAPMRLTRAVLPRMIAAGAGTIVNVASEAALRGSSAGVAYTSSKHAIVGLTRSVAFFHGSQGIRANAVAPGAVQTNVEAPMGSVYAAERIGPLVAAVSPVVAQPEQLAAAISWLLSDDSANVNGAILPSDGGWSVV